MPNVPLLLSHNSGYGGVSHAVEVTAATP